MEFITKCVFFSAFVTAIYARYVLQERNAFETFDKETNAFNTSDNERIAFEALDNANCSCDWRYFRHYETKGCVVETEDSCGCPQKFNCSSNQTHQAPAKVCIYQNKEYKVGSKIITSNACQVCRCRDGIPPQISCTHFDCFQIPAAEGKNCHLVYKDNRCCPIRYECVESEFEASAEITRNKTCEYNGQFYPFGSKIYPEDDPCQICICNEKWNGVDNSSCYVQDCVFERSKSKLDAGCIPVYHEKRCCPIEFYCPSSHNLSYSKVYNNELSENYNASYDNHCIFADEFYEVGEEMSIGNPCVKCSCAVPPDFTCVHQTCPAPPSKENCQVFYYSGECCPSYECMLGDGSEPHADGCPTPLCADSSCRIETPPGHECPTCVCRENISELEHNNLEQVQQINQNMEQMEPLQHAFESIGNSDEDSEDELQMMPLRIQDSEGQIPTLEKMIMPEEEGFNQYSEGLRELEESSNEDNSSLEAVYNESKEFMLSERKNSTFLPEFNDTDLETFSNQSEKAVQKRSNVDDSVVPVELTQEATQEINEDIEREGVELEGNDESFDDELENFKNRIFDKNSTIINEIITINYTVKVPPGCPTPLCEGPWCKIGIPEGHQCPTCICKRHTDNEP